MTKMVLVVDDDPTQRRLIQAVLEREGFAVAHADSGDAAISHLMAGARVDLILLDLVMPRLSGQDTLKEMRARGFHQPVIVVTAQGSIDTVVQAMQAGDPNYKSTTRDVRRLLDDLKEQGVDGVVMDLRNNGGGALHEANDLVGLFIDKGPTVQIRNANNDVQILNDEDPSVAYDGPLVVLVNRMSASASEIFAGAIQDYGRGLVVGSQTFGKGTVQAVRPLNHGQLKITQSKFYRVSGGSTQHKGVIPDIEIPSRVDTSRIGEDALDHALPWDQIEAVPHTRYFDFSGVIDELRRRHEARFSASPEFSLLEQEIEFLTKQREMTYVSLNMDERKAHHEQIERTRLTIANARRELRGEEPFKTLDELEQWQDEQAADLDSTDEELDFVIREGGHIMADLLELDQRTASILKPTQFAAKAEAR